jgi:hypothetical protein
MKMWHKIVATSLLCLPFIGCEVSVDKAPRVLKGNVVSKTHIPSDLIYTPVYYPDSNGMIQSIPIWTPVDEEWRITIQNNVGSNTIKVSKDFYELYEVGDFVDLTVP